MDRNQFPDRSKRINCLSLSARRAWIEIQSGGGAEGIAWSLSARRAWIEIFDVYIISPLTVVALRKESVDRNPSYLRRAAIQAVALRKESVDRNRCYMEQGFQSLTSLSARRAWIEMIFDLSEKSNKSSLSARRAWIEIVLRPDRRVHGFVALRKESVDRNHAGLCDTEGTPRRSPQGERG